MAALVGTMAAVLATWRYRDGLRSDLLRPPRPPEKRLEGFDPEELASLMKQAKAFKADVKHGADADEHQGILGSLAKLFGG